MMLGIYLYLYSYDIPLLFSSCGRGYLNFFLGVVIAKIVSKYSKPVNKAFFSLISLSALAIFGFSFHVGILGNMSIMFSLVFNVAIMLLSLNIPLLYEISSNKAVKWLGSISFSVYLWNIPVSIFFKLFEKLGIISVDYSRKSCWLVYVIVSLSVSILSYELFEKKMTVWLKKNEEK